MADVILLVAACKTQLKVRQKKWDVWTCLLILGCFAKVILVDDQTPRFVGMLVPIFR